MVAISAPSSLASFTASRASSSKNPHVTLSTVEGSGGKLGVATVQGDGVWTYDLVSLRPVSTYTVPPSTRFAGPAISYIIQPPSPLANGSSKGKGKEKQREEDAEEVAEVMEVDGEEDVELSSSVDSEESPAEPSGPVRRTMVPVEVKEQGEVLVWDGEEGDEKVVIHLDHPTRRLHTIPSSPYPVIAIHSASQLSLIGPRHTVHPISAPSASSASAHIITSRVVPSDAVSSGLITVTETGQVTSLRIEHPEDGNPSLRVISESVIALPSVPASTAKAAAVGKNDASTPKKSRNRHSTAASAKATIASADIRSDGLVALITSTGAVMTYDIRTSSIISAAQPIASPSSAAVLLLPASAPGDSRKAVSLVPTAKSSTTPASLIATLSSVSPAVVGAADIASILPTEQSSVQHLQILKEGSKGRCVVGLVAWHPTQTAGTPSHGQTPQAKEAEKEKEKGGRSIVHLVEVDAPLKSVGMSALLGSAATTAKYFSSETGKSATATTSGGAMPSAEIFTPATSPLDALISRPSRSAADWTSVHSILASPSGSTIPSAQLARVLKLSIAEGEVRTAEMYQVILELPPPDLAFRLELRRQLNAEEGSALLGLLMRWAEAVVEGDEGVKWGQEIDTILLHASLLLDSLLPLLLSHLPAHSHLTALSDLLGPMLEQQRTLSQLRAPIDALLTLAKREERRRALVREKRAALRGEHGAAGQEGKEGKSGKGSAKLSEAERTRMNRGTGQAGRLGLGGDVGLWSVEEFDF